MKGETKLMYKKHSFVLIEVILSFMLVALIVSSLYSLYAATSIGTASLEKSIQRQRRLGANARKIRHYLSSIISVRNMLSGKGAAIPFFFTEGTNGSPGFQVYACLYNGVDPVPAFSNEVLGRFRIDERGRFVLTIASHPIRAEIFHHQYESDIILWENVDSIFWEFLSWPDKGVTRKKEDHSIDAAPAGIWCSEWRQEWMYTPPGIVRLKIRFTPEETKKQEEAVITAVQPTAVQPLKFLSGT